MMKMRPFLDEPCPLNHSENDVRRGRGGEGLRESLWVAPYWFKFLKVFFHLKQYERISSFNIMTYDNDGRHFFFVRKVTLSILDLSRFPVPSSPSRFAMLFLR